MNAIVHLCGVPLALIGLRYLLSHKDISNKTNNNRKPNKFCLLEPILRMKRLRSLRFLPERERETDNEINAVCFSLLCTKRR